MDDFSNKLLTAAFQIAVNVENKVYRVNALNEIALTYDRFHLKNQALEMLSLAEAEAKKIERNFDKIWQLNEIAAKYIEIGFQDKFLSLLEEALELAKTNDDVDNRDYQFIDIADNYGKICDYDRVFEIAKLIDDPWRRDTRLYVDLVRECIEANHHELVNKIIEEADCYDGFLVEEAIACYLSKKDFKHTFAIVNAIKDSPTKISGLLDIADRYLELERLEKVLEILPKIRQLIDTVTDSYTKNNLLEKLSVQYIQAGQKDYGLEIRAREGLPDLQYYELIEIKEYDRAVEEIELNSNNIDNDKKIASLTKIADIYSELGQGDRAVEIIDKALNLFFNNKDKYVVQTIFNSCIKAKQTEKALQLLEEYYQIVKTEKNRKIEICYLMSIAIMYAKLGKYDRAIEVADSLESKLEKLKTLAQIAIILGRFHSWKPENLFSV